MMRKILILIFFLSGLFGNSCKTKLFSFSTEGENGMVLQNIITDISDTCHLNILIKDKIAEQQLKKEIKYVKLKDLTLDEFLDSILSKNGFFYKLKNDVLEISYLKTESFKIDYINSATTGNTDLTASLSSGQDGGTTGSGSNSISSTFDFDFWTNFAKNLQQFLNNQSNEIWTIPTPIIDKLTGIITIKATKFQLEKVKNYLEELNKRLHKEVMIDVKIYSVQLSKSHQTGINWSQLNFELPAQQVPVTGGSKFLGSQTIFNSAVFNISGFLKFLAENGQVNSISNPKITTLNNQKAIITVGETVNYSYSKTTTDKNGNLIKSDVPGSQFVGILLDIIPQISDDNIIMMRINPSISSISQLNQNVAPNTIDKKLNTIIRAKDGDTIILGGLITDENTFSANGVPILREIPIVKSLFSYKSKISNRKELVFVITPHIIDLNKKQSLEKSGFKLPKLGDL
jgi:general secretion pathway protein D